MAQTTIHVSSAAQLMSALASATGGETILLQSGNYGQLTLNGQSQPFAKFADTVTIKSADPEAPATFSSVNLVGVENLSFDSVKFDHVSASGAALWQKPFTISGGSENITIANSTFDGDLAHGVSALDDGYATGFGLEVANSSNITITNNEFFDWYRAAVFVNSDNLSVTQNDVHSIRSDGFDFIEVNDVLIEANHIHDFAANIDSGDHVDMIQFWTTGTTSPSTNITIRGNILNSAAGDWAQSIFMRNEVVDLGLAGQEMFYRNILIEDNVIYNAHAHGITVGETDALIIRNNTVLYNAAANDGSSVHIPTINSSAASTNVQVINNIVPRLSLQSGPNIIVDNNLIVQRDDPNAPNYVGNLFVNALADANATLADLVAIPNGIVEQMGVGSALTIFAEFPASPIGFILNEAGTGLNLLSHDFDASNLFGPAGQIDTAGASVVWDFGDGSAATGLTTTHTYQHAGHYGVQATVTLADSSVVLINTTIVVETPVALRVDFDNGYEDLSDIANAASVGAAVTIEAGQDGNAIRLNGGMVNYDTTPEFLGNSEYTLLLDFKKDQGNETASGRVINFGGSFILDVQSNGLRAAVITDQGVRWLDVSGVGVNDADWHQVALTFSGTQGSAILYLDGAEVARVDNLAGQVQQGSSSQAFYVGDPWGGGLPGLLDNVLFLRGAMDAQQIQAHYQSAADAPAAPAITSWSNDTGTAGDGVTSDNTLAFTGTAAANSTVRIYDGATLLGTVTTNGSGAWSFTTATLTDGAHSFTATATDTGGNTSAASSALSVTIDTGAPAAPAIASWSNDTGTAGDGITNDNTLAFTGTAQANSTVRIYDGATLLGTAIANGSGAWSFTTATLTNGAHSFTATATDVAGNVSAASSALSVTIDTAAPAAPSIASWSTDTGTAGDGVTSDNTLAFTGTAQANSTVRVYDGATLLGTVTANGSGAWSFTTATLSDGAHSFTATATDAAGNVSAASSALSVTIDTGAPAAPAISSWSTDSGVAGDGVTSDNTLVFTGTAQANSTVRVYDGATLLGTVTANGSGAWSFTTATLTDGTHSFTATATDTGGNTSAASSALSVTVDTTAPAAPAIVSWSNDTGAAGDGITSDNTLAFTGSAQPNSTVRFYDGATLLGTVTANGSGVWTFTTAALADGAHSFTATATDAAGNLSAASSARNVTIDTTAPAAPAITSWSNDTDVAGDGITADNTLAFTGTAAANSTVRIYDGATLLGTVTANGSGAWSFTTATLADGLHSFTATATDTAGNVSAASSALSVTVDAGAPAAPVIVSFSNDSGVVGDRITNDNTLTFTGTAQANSTVRVYDGATLLGTVTANGSGAWSYSTAALGDGAHNFTATATDGDGDTGPASVALNVTIDTTAPAAPIIASFSKDTGVVGDGITADNTLTFTGSAQAHSTVQVYDGATLLGTATANGSGAWKFTTAVLPDGNHSFTATVADTAGNSSAASAVLSLKIDRSTGPVSTQSFTDAANQQPWSSYSASMSGGKYTSLTYVMDDGITSAIVYDPYDLEDFADYLVTYNSGWQVTRIIFNYDDNTHTVAAYDMANEYSFADYLATFDSQWNLIRNIFINDDGTNSVINYDVQNEHSWSWVIFDYDSNWNLIGQHGVNDDGSSFGNSYIGSGEAGGQLAQSYEEHPNDHTADAPHDMPAWFGVNDEPAPGASGSGAVQNENMEEVGADDTIEHDSHGPSDLPVWIGAMEDVGLSAFEHSPNNAVPAGDSDFAADIGPGTFGERTSPMNDWSLV